MNESIQGLSTYACGSEAGVVTRLTNSREGKWYTIVMDNFFTLPLLFEDLLRRGFYTTSTPRQKQIGFPTNLKILEKGTRGAIYVYMHRDRHMVAIHWQDTKGVSFLSTLANPVQWYGMDVMRNCSEAPKSIPASPPQQEYPMYMRGVDIQDQLRGTHSTQIFTKKWWHRIYIFLLDTALTNTFIMHKHVCTEKGLKSLDHKTFQLEVVYALISS